MAPMCQGNVCEDVRDLEAGRPSGPSCGSGAGVGSWVSSEDATGDGGGPSSERGYGRMWLARGAGLFTSCTWASSVAASFTEARETGEWQLMSLWDIPQHGGLCCLRRTPARGHAGPEELGAACLPWAVLPPTLMPTGCPSPGSAASACLGLHRLAVLLV